MILKKGTAHLAFPNGHREVAGWYAQSSAKGRPMFLHREGGGSWTLSDPQTGLAYLLKMPTRKSAMALLSDLTAVLLRHAKRNGMAA